MGAISVGDVVLTSYRDIREVIGSLIRMKWIDPDVGIVMKYVSDYIDRLEDWERRSVLVVRYEKMVKDGDEALALISCTLGLQLSRGTLQTVAQSIRALNCLNLSWIMSPNFT